MTMGTPDAPPAESVSPGLGACIRRIRVQRGQTLQAMARQTGLTPSFISQVERDLVSPSVTSLRRMAQALETSVASFFEGEAGEALLQVVRKADRQSWVNQDTHLVVEHLIPESPDGRLQPKHFILRAGGEIKEEHTRQADEAFGWVLRGQVDVYQGDAAPQRLMPGDAIHVRNQKPVRVTKPGPQRAE